MVDSYGKLVGTYTSPMEAMGKMAIRNLHHFGFYESTILDAIDQRKVRISHGYVILPVFLGRLLTKTILTKMFQVV